MNKLIIVLIAFLMFGCSKQLERDVRNLKTDTLDLTRYHTNSNRQLYWLVNQDEFRKMKAEYPEDIKLIQPVLSKFKKKEIEACKLWIKGLSGGGRDLFQCDIVISKLFLIPTPMYKTDDNIHYYLLFNPNRGDNEVFIKVENQTVIMVVKDKNEDETEKLRKLKKEDSTWMRQANKHYLLQMIE